MRFRLNGRQVDVAAHPMKRLLDVLREDCRLTGTKEGCGEGECGACTVLVDGRAVNACLIPFAHVRDADVQTIEGLRGHFPLQRAFAELGGSQCGICTPGMIIAAAALPAGATIEDVRLGLAGNLCRCTGYGGIYRAIQHAQAEVRGMARASDIKPSDADQTVPSEARTPVSAAHTPERTPARNRVRGVRKSVARAAGRSRARRKGR